MDKQCLACGLPFKPHPQVPQQSYCSAQKCQSERKSRWQRLKLISDPDYVNNQARAQKAWNERNPDYWKNYRNTHPKYVERNRSLQRARNAKSKPVPIAKMDTLIPDKSMPSGIYQVRLITGDDVAKMDVSIVEITVHSYK